MTMELYKSIDMLLKNKESVIVAIEGGSASGKTTLAKKLEQKILNNRLGFRNPLRLYMGL